MYNLLMVCDTNQKYWEEKELEPVKEDRLFEYTDKKIEDKYKDNIEELTKLPCLFTYERLGSLEIKAHVGRIQSIELISRTPTTVEFKYALDRKIPVINIDTRNSFFELPELGITHKYEWNRTHWAVKKEDLFEYVSKYFIKKVSSESIWTTDDMIKIWGENYQRKQKIFFSHKAKYKKEISNIKTELEKENFCCFIAHEDIHPTSTWQKEIIKALDTMDIFVGVVTNDFHEGSWTDQEIGYAYKRNIPRIFLKMGVSDPKGFVASEQAITSDWNNVHTKIIEYLKNSQ